MRPHFSWWIAALLLLGPGAPAHAAPGSPPDEAIRSGAVAARGCWSVEDGCVGRTGASADPPLRGSVVPAWSWTVPADPGGTIEEEPRTWLDHVYVSVRSDPTRAALFVLGTWDGLPSVAPLRVETADRLEPCACDHGVLIRSASNELSLVKPMGGRWVEVWKVAGPHGWVDSHLLHGGRLYARTDKGLCAWVVGRAQPDWVVEGTFRGRPAIGAGRLWTLAYDENGNCSLSGRDLSGGGQRELVFLGHHGSRTAPPEAWHSRLAVAAGLGLVDHAAPMETQRGTARTSISDLVRDASLFDFPGPVAVRGSQWIGYAKEEGQTLLKLNERLPDGGIRSWDLAGSKDRPGFCRPDLGSTLTQDACWVGTGAFALGDRRVLCRLPEREIRFRVVPAWDRVLSVPDLTRLVAWRPDDAATDGPFVLGPAGEGERPVPQTGVEGTVLFRDGVLHSGPFDLDPAAGRVAAGKGKPAARPLTDVLFATDKAQRLLYVASMTWLERHLERGLDLRRRDAVVALLKDARGARSADLVERVLFEALQRGAPEKALVDARKDLEQMRKAGAVPNEAKAKTTEAKLRDLLAPSPSDVLAVLATSLGDPRPQVDRALLRRVLDRQPDHAAAVARVRSGLPAHVKPSEPFVARDWIDVGSALAAIPTKPVDVPPEGTRPLTPGERELGAARHTWRPDLVGVESAQLLVITPLKAPERLAACLALGELVCTALEDVFASGEHVSKVRWPLILQLFETPEEYRKFQAPGAGEPEESREWSAGHYDPEAGVSRIHVPAGDGNLEAVRRTYAHELTHHWIQERCPLFEARNAKYVPDSPNWIVEGMAELVESFDWDVPARSWQTFVPTAQSLDTLAGAPARASWRAFFDITSAEFHRLDRTEQHKIPLRNQLGYTVKASDLTLFYATSGAVCMYLFHAGAKERTALLTYVRDAYTGKVHAGAKHIEEHFGMTPEALGRAAVDWARGVTEGRIQKKDVFLK